jgi:DNA polymerase I-like protein with 3'-5' exonuclease and polymerase domains
MYFKKAKRFGQISQMYRIHSTIDLFHVTGRMNFNDPCLQHIPKDFDINLDELNLNNLNENDGEINDELIKPDCYEEGTAFFLDKISNNNECKIQMKNCVSIRSLFIPTKDRVFLSADYCQLELRIITNLCKDENLIESFNDKQNDIFNSLASKWLNLPINEIDDEKRQNVKKVSYFYGLNFSLDAK